MSIGGVAVSQRQTMGEYLRASRRRRRISLERAAEETRIRPDYLMRMESDDFDFLAPAYVRGFLRSYARFLNVDPDPLLKEFDQRFGSGRVDTAQILAAERRSQRRPARDKPRINRWLIAASVATGLLAVLSVIGLTEPPLSSRQGREGRPGDVAGGERNPPREAKPSASPSPSATPKPATPSSSPSEPSVLADRPMTVEVEAKRGECWVEVDADGSQIYTSTPPLITGDRAGPFTAQESMTIILGNPFAVDLIVNGQRVGPIGEPGIPITITLPDDAEELSG
ncbi:MAG: helix-turn-helix domain-containing protein [Actinomycetota bacterium]